jgi:hypothetical protein
MASAVTTLPNVVYRVCDHVKICAFHRASDPDVQIMIPGSLSFQVLLKLIVEKAQKIHAENDSWCR